ncbi:YjcQ family protein [Fusobacteria bacterium ZRK30]|nr:YjcQ family protein [Fusobacteria bacterium ZRK30]
METYYIILNYINECYKKGNPIENADSFPLKELELDELEFNLILQNLFDKDYIRGIEMVYEGASEVPVIISELTATFDGHQYLSDNKELSKTQKALNFMKLIKETIPMI